MVSQTIGAHSLFNLINGFGFQLFIPERHGFFHGRTATKKILVKTMPIPDEPGQVFLFRASRNGTLPPTVPEPVTLLREPGADGAPNLS